MFSHSLRFDPRPSKSLCFEGRVFIVVHFFFSAVHVFFVFVFRVHGLDCVCFRCTTLGVVRRFVFSSCSVGFGMVRFLVVIYLFFLFLQPSHGHHVSYLGVACFRSRSCRRMCFFVCVLLLVEGDAT